MVFQGKGNVQNDECFSHSSSNHESWGRCSSLGISDEESSLENFARCSLNVNEVQQVLLSSVLTAENNLIHS
jgi:hypothetical protein